MKYRVFLSCLAYCIVAMPATLVNAQIPEEDIIETFLAGLLADQGVFDPGSSLLDDLVPGSISDALAQLSDAERDALLAELGTPIACALVLALLTEPLDVTPIYSEIGVTCEVTDPSGPDAGSYFSDAACATEIPFKSTSFGEYCATRLSDQAKFFLGNAASWVPDTAQPNDPLPALPSLPWTTTPATTMDVGVKSIQDNFQPYMKRYNYKTVTGLPRGTGTCALEMRVYKKDITETNLRPVLAIHGGSWRYRGFGFWGLESLISHLTETGFVVFVPFYRLAGESDTTSTIECNGADWRGLTSDVESALDWVIENGPALGAADGRISVYGQSAGAHLSAWLAAHRPDDVRKALLYYPPIDALELLPEITPLGGPNEAFRDFILRTLTRFYGAKSGPEEVQLEQIDFAGVDAAMLAQNWETLIPGSVFNLTMLDPLSPSLYVGRCATETQIDLSAINLALPPNNLLSCMKKDLSEFLIENSFNDLLADEEVPVYAIHGTVDKLIPHSQSVNLCGAIDGRVLSSDVTVARTDYDCGASSQVQIIRDAGHMLELDVCTTEVCPAGDIGTSSRQSVAIAVDEGYVWFTEDSAPIASATTTLGDGTPVCFIATAAYGSYLDPHVQVLRDFRDDYLLTNGPGRAFVEFYYRTSPPIADVISEHEVLRWATRLALTPVVFSVAQPIAAGTTLLIFGMIVFCVRRRGWQVLPRRRSDAPSADPA